MEQDKLVVPKLVDSGWDSTTYSFTEQKTFADVRAIMKGKGYKRGNQKRADNILRYRRNFPIAVVLEKLIIQQKFVQSGGHLSTALKCNYHYTNRRRAAGR